MCVWQHPYYSNIPLQDTFSLLPVYEFFMKTKIFIPCLISFLSLGLVWWFWLPPSQAWLERHYSQQLYRHISRVISPLVAALPFSLSSLLLIILPLAWLIFSLYSWRQRFFSSWTLTTLLALLLLASSFLFLWGGNYQRQPVAEQMDLAEIQNEDVAVAFAYVLLEQVQQHAPSQALTAQAEREAIHAVSQALHTLVAELQGSAPTIPHDVKRLPAGTLVRWQSLGVMSPWLLEPHVDSALPAPYLIVVAAHELAHSAGYAQEADADMLGMLAALRAKNSDAQYAGAFYALGKLLPALPAAVQEDIHAQLPAISQQQRHAYQQMFSDYPQAEFLLKLQARAYDGYLRSQGVKGGIASYRRSITLLLRAYQQGDIFQP